jgi:hypothetical protein
MTIQDCVLLFWLIDKSVCMCGRGGQRVWLSGGPLRVFFMIPTCNLGLNDLTPTGSEESDVQGTFLRKGLDEALNFIHMPTSPRERLLGYIVIQWQHNAGLCRVNHSA